MIRFPLIKSLLLSSVCIVEHLYHTVKINSYRTRIFFDDILTVDLYRYNVILLCVSSVCPTCESVGRRRRGAGAHCDATTFCYNCRKAPTVLLIKL